MADTNKPRRLASPKINPNGAKNPTLSFRVRGDLYDRLKASAETRGYSLSEEIEHRLSRSLDTAGDHFAELALQLIADNWRAIQSLSRRKIIEDKFTLQACCEAAYRATELLASVNGIDLRVGLLGEALGESVNIEAGKQLGHAIVYHRELLHMKNPPEWATPVYEANVVEALAKRVAELKERVAEQPSPALEAAGKPALFTEPVSNKPAGRLVGDAEAASDFEPVRGQLPASIGDTALLHETMGPDRDRDIVPSDPVEPAPAPTRREKAKASA